MLLEPDLDPEKYELLWEIIFSPERHTRNDNAAMPLDDSEANYVVAIYDSPAEGVIMPMDNTKYDKLFGSVNNELFTYILHDERSIAPTFVFNKHACGVMKIGCSSNEAKSWLSNRIKNIAPLWHNMQLESVDFDKLPPQNTVLGKFRHCILSAEQILRILIAMNPELSVKSWTILGSKRMGNVMHIVFGITEKPNEQYFALNFGVGYACFRDISKEQLEPWMFCSNMEIEIRD